MRIKKSQEGFTLVELMIVVAIVGVLAALAIYGVRRYVLNAKTTEARNAIGQMANDATSAFDREGMEDDLLAAGSQTEVVNRLCGSANGVPNAVPQGKKHQSSPADWTAGDQFNGWRCLRFSMGDPQYYQYNYVSTSTTGNFTAMAVGDLDGDGITSTFTLMGGVINQSGELMARRAPNIGEVRPDE